MDYKNYIQLSLAQGVNFSIGKAIKEGFGHLGKNVGAYVGFTVLSFFIMIATVVFSMFIPFLGNLVVGVLISPALMMGFAIYARKTELNQNPQFESFFDGFRTNYTQLILVNLIIQILTGALALLFLSPILADLMPFMQDLLLIGEDPAAATEFVQEIIGIVIQNWWAIALAILVTVVIQVLYVLSNYFVVFYGFGFWEAMESSRHLVGKVFFKVIVLNIIMGFIIAFGAIFTLGLGMLFLFPASILVNFSVFHQIAGFAEAEMDLEDDLIV